MNNSNSAVLTDPMNFKLHFAASVKFSSGERLRPIVLLVYGAMMALIAIQCWGANSNTSGTTNDVLSIKPVSLSPIDATQDKITPPEDPKLQQELRGYPYKLIFETYRNDNWELFVSAADGESQENLTKSPNIDEHYPKVSPDGKKIAFEVHVGNEKEVKRSVWYMDADGKNRTKVMDNALQPAWSPDGKIIAYMKGPDQPSDYYVSRGLCFYELATGKHTNHQNGDIANLINLNYTPDGKWIIATVVAAMGFSQPILAVEISGNRIVKLVEQDGRNNIAGCRPDVSSDGKQMVWSVENIGKSMWLNIADLDFSGSEPKAVHWRKLLEFPMPTHETYHADWSPDSKYIAFSSGPAGGKMLGAVYVIGRKSPGWNICVTEVAHPERYFKVTTNGLSNKEPDWMPIPTNSN